MITANPPLPLKHAEKNELDDTENVRSCLVFVNINVILS